MGPWMREHFLPWPAMLMAGFTKERLILELPSLHSTQELLHGPVFIWNIDILFIMGFLRQFWFFKLLYLKLYLMETLLSRRHNFFFFETGIVFYSFYTSTLLNIQLYSFFPPMLCIRSLLVIHFKYSNVYKDIIIIIRESLSIWL